MVTLSVYVRAIIRNWVNLVHFPLPRGRSLCPQNSGLPRRKYVYVALVQLSISHFPFSPYFGTMYPVHGSWYLGTVPVHVYHPTVPN